MAKMTLIQIVKNILSSMDSDDVNSINDTVEALQVAEVVKETYFALIDELNLPSKGGLVNLESAVPAFPTKMRIPDTVTRIDWIKYNREDATIAHAAYKDVIYLTPQQFMDHILSRNSEADNYVEYTDDGIVYVLRNDTIPTYWTSIDDKHIIFDSWDSATETNLQGSKTTVRALYGHGWTMDDDYIPDLPENLFTLLLNEAKSTSFFNFKQTVHNKAEQYNRRQRIALRKNKFATDGGIPTPNYGRKTRK